MEKYLINLFWVICLFKCIYLIIWVEVNFNNMDMGVVIGCLFRKGRFFMSFKLLYLLNIWIFFFEI